MCHCGALSHHVHIARSRDDIMRGHSDTPPSCPSVHRPQKGDPKRGIRLTNPLNVNFKSPRFSILSDPPFRIPLGCAPYSLRIYIYIYIYIHDIHTCIHLYHIISYYIIILRILYDIYLYTCIDVCVYIYIYMYIHTCIFIFMYMCIYIYIYIIIQPPS